MVDHKPVKSYPSTVPPSNAIDGRSMAQVCLVSSWLFHALLVVMSITVKILKIGTPKIITIIVLQLEQLDFTVQ